MSRTYSVRVAALLLRLDNKWLDNLLSRFLLRGVHRSRQGVERRVSEEGLLAIELCRILNIELGVSLHRSVVIAETALQGGGTGIHYRTPSGLTLSMDRDELQRRLRERIVDAVEASPVIRRGRPPRRVSRGEP